MTELDLYYNNTKTTFGYCGTSGSYDTSGGYYGSLWEIKTTKQPGGSPVLQDVQPNQETQFMPNIGEWDNESQSEPGHSDGSGDIVGLASAHLLQGIGAICDRPRYVLER